MINESAKRLQSGEGLSSDQAAGTRDSVLIFARVHLRSSADVIGSSTLRLARRSHVSPRIGGLLSVWNPIKRRFIGPIDFFILCLLFLQLSLLVRTEPWRDGLRKRCSDQQRRHHHRCRDYFHMTSHFAFRPHTRALQYRVHDFALPHFFA